MVVERRPTLDETPCSASLRTAFVRNVLDAIPATGHQGYPPAAVMAAGSPLGVSRKSWLPGCSREA